MRRMMKLPLVAVGLMLLIAPVGLARGQSVDHAPFDRILTTHVKEGAVDYQSIAEKDGDTLDALYAVLGEGR